MAGESLVPLAFAMSVFQPPILSSSLVSMFVASHSGKASAPIDVKIAMRAQMQSTIVFAMEKGSRKRARSS